MCTSCGKVDAPFREVSEQGRIFQRTAFASIDDQPIRGVAVTADCCTREKKKRALSEILCSSRRMASPASAPLHAHHEVDQRAALACTVVDPQVLVVIYFHAGCAIFAQRRMIQAVITSILGRTDALCGEVFPYRELIDCFCVHKLFFFHSVYRYGSGFNPPYRFRMV